MADILNQISQLGECFQIEGELIEGVELNGGHINTTYVGTYRSGSCRRRLIFQRINEFVFPDVDALMGNIEAVTKHLREKLAPNSGRQTLQLFPAHDGRSFTTRADGGSWRCYNFIEGCRAYEVVETTEQARQAAFAFGEFQGLLSDLSPKKLSVTLPGFHDTGARFEQLMGAAASDSVGRLKKVRQEVEFFTARKELVTVLTDHLAAGRLAERITHNDTKLNNVMIDEETDQAVCVIDLDTVMPGLVLYDFGDLVRCATSPATEDERDLSKVEMRMPMFEALVDGYLSAAHSFLSPLEVELLPFSAKLITLETGMRFLTDYLNGDRYFKTHREDHNLDRCRTQMALVRSIERQEATMNQVVAKWRPG